MTTRLEWRRVRKRLGGAEVLRGFSLEVPAGCSVVVLGASGAGKSVAMKIAAGLLAPDDGEVLMDGLALPRGAGHARRYGMLFQGAALFDSLKVWENVAFRLLHADRMARREARNRAIAALEQVRLGEDLADRLPDQLSGGMRKRVGLARAIVGEPELLFLDEPTTGLDPATAQAIDELIVQQVRRLGCSAVTITHDVASAHRIANEVALLEAGVTSWRGSPAELADARPPELRRFLGLEL